MIVEPHDDAEAYKVWLDGGEIRRLLDAAREAERVRFIAFALQLRSGLRSHEVLDVTPDHVVDDDHVGTMLVVPEGKGDKYRETPIPPTLAETIRTVGDYVPGAVVDKSTRTLRRWVTNAGDYLADETGDDRWSYLSTHDLRRTWAGRLAANDVDQQTALQWGGWNDLETFLEHYRGVPTPEEQRQERDKVDWL